MTRDRQEDSVKHRPTVGFRIRSILMAACAFERMPVGASVQGAADPLSTTPQVGDLQLRIDQGWRAGEADGDDHVFDATLTITATGVDGRWTASTTFTGTFVIAPNSELAEEVAHEITAPSYLYGFAREHVADLARRAGLHVMLPPTRFSRLAT